MSLPAIGHRVLIWAGAWEIAFRYERGDRWRWFDGKMTEWDPEDVKEWRELPEDADKPLQCSYKDTCKHYRDCDYYKYYTCGVEEIGEEYGCL